MEFDEMKKIWDAQNNQALYAIDETALYKKVLNKKQKARKMANLTEWILIFANIIAGTMVLIPSIVKDKFTISGMLMMALMYFTAGLIVMRRSRRLKSQDNFDRDLLGDLDNAIATAKYQVSLSGMGRYYLIMVAVLALTALLEAGSPWWIMSLALIFFVLTYFAGKWEHKTFYVSQKKNLEAMRSKLASLQDEEPESSTLDQMI